MDNAIDIAATWEHLAFYRFMRHGRLCHLYTDRRIGGKARIYTLY
jgi:hypothetical protein